MQNLTFRNTSKDDLPSLINMLSDDFLGANREDNSHPINPAYLEVFNAINSDPNNELIVVEHSSELIGMLQLTFIPYLTHTGSWRCLIEGVRVNTQHRGQGIGTKIFEWAMIRAQQRNCAMIQLTSNKQRPEAIKFYERLGFIASHEGFKYELKN